MNNSTILSIVTFVYGFAALLYVISWIFNKELPGKIATWVTIAGATGNAGGIILRWVESYQQGMGHAPLSNKYESLVFFAFAIAVCYLIMEFKYKNRLFGVFALPLSLLAIAYASLPVITDQLQPHVSGTIKQQLDAMSAWSNVNYNIQPLIPALKSNWLITHVVTCFIGYAGFAIAFGTSLMYVLKAKESKSHFFIFFSIGTAAGIIIWNLGLLQIFNKVYIDIGFWSIIIYLMVIIIISFVCLQLRKIIGTYAVSFIGTGILIGCTWWGLAIKVHFDFSFHVVLIFIICFCAAYLFDFLVDYILPFVHFPEFDMLDELTHQLVMFGFLFLTIGIITGSVWANTAWGRYWGWDNKEIWSLITWLIYAALLHVRISRGWSGIETAILSIIGFTAVIFTYFGVNYLPGLHSYG